jgi:histidine triad (HIT) family protein
MDDCIFCKIRDHEIAKEFSYEDEDVMVFPDIHPVKPTHLLIIPKKHITEFLSIGEPVLFSKIGTVIQRMIRQFDLEARGYRIVVNGGGAQDVHHVHFHLMGPLTKSEH